MRETLPKSAATGRETQEIANDEVLSPWRKRAIKMGAGVAGVTAVVAATLGGVKVFSNAEAESAPTASEDIIDESTVDQATAEPTEAETNTPEALTTENFRYTFNGGEYVGIEAFSEALSIPATSIDAYPDGTINTGERDTAIQEEVQAGIENWVELADEFINYEFTDQDYAEFSQLQYTDSKGRPYIGVDAARALFVAPAFEQAMLHDSKANIPYPEDFMEDLLWTATRVEGTRLWTASNGEVPYEAHLVIADMQFGGTEILNHPDYESSSTGITASGEVALFLESNQGEGNTAPFDLLGDQDVDYFSTTDPVPLRIEANGGTGKFKVTDVSLAA